jgi:hypothetical protein
MAWFSSSVEAKPTRRGEGRKLGIPYADEATCPVRALEAWHTAAGIQSGPLFRPVNRHCRVLANRLSGEGVAIVVKRYVEKLGHNQRSSPATACGLASPLPPPQPVSRNGPS